MAKRTKSAPPKKKSKKSPWLVFLAIALGIVIGPLVGTKSALFGITFYSLFDVIGTLFIRALTLIVVPLVASSIISGIARMGSESTFGRLGLKTFGFYITTTFLAVLTGILFVNMIRPGVDGVSEAMTQQAQQYATSPEHLAAQKLNSAGDLLFQIIPANIFDAFSKGNMLGIIFFSLLFGYAMSRIDKYANTLLSSAGCVSGYDPHYACDHEVSTTWSFLSRGESFATTGLDSLKSLLWFSLTVILALAFFMFVVLPLLLKFVGKVSPINHFRAMAPALVTAFSTSSSSASLPVTLDCVEKRAGVSNRI